MCVLFETPLPAVDDALDQLLDLSPFDLKNLIHLIFSRKEFTVDESESITMATLMTSLQLLRGSLVET